MCAGQQLQLLGAEQPARAVDRLQLVLGADDRVIVAQAEYLSLDESAVIRVELREHGPGKLEVRGWVISQIGGTLLGQQGVLAPGCAVEHGRGVGRGRHGPEILEVLLLRYV